MKLKKGQAAIEFLTTYSWAIMFILITLGALVYFDVFSTTRFLTETCESGAQISCAEAAITESGVFHIRLVNNHPVNITIKSIEVDWGADGISAEFTENNVLGRGDNEVFQVPTGLGLSSNNREQFNLLIVFSRTGGSNDYDVRGRAVVRPLPDGIIPP